eukprot:jgi/Chlat1/8020/Chrsp7S07781
MVGHIVDPAQAEREQAKRMMVERDGLETEIAVIAERLNAPGGPGEHGPLVDNEGFPRADIDVFQVRKDRNRLAALHTDHKELTARIEKLMYDVMSKTANSSFRPTPSAAPVRATPLPAAQQSIPLPTPSITAAAPLPRPFAVIDEVAEGSPAAEGGIQVGDQLARFGLVDAASSSGQAMLGLVANELQSRANQPVEVMVIRRGRRADLSVTPHTWSGRGLLGVT